MRLALMYITGGIQTLFLPKDKSKGTCVCTAMLAVVGKLQATWKLQDVLLNCSFMYMLAITNRCLGYVWC